MRKPETLSGDEHLIPFRDVIGFANDHAGFPLRLPVLDLLARHSGRIIDVGAQSEEPVDFPDITRRAVQAILDKQTDRVILLCGTGAGACIAANKVRGIRAAVAHDTYVARQAVVHDDVNVLCIGAWITGPQIALDIIRHFLAAQFSDEEHFRRRVAKLAMLEQGG
ncbi:Sugar-phosphate isomerase, RpiB/LacA/LacB family [Sphingobium herbicidovorans NBRC 16415]|jgi:ribose 5-phosphate isomerase B|uniref:Sugar-phosphate isomerase, RpiB/LacA/LacB family n=1 Tax=Sphingobium herbicidovorans (strain ATCC 700291 / DSM 11019 / CCUG 56400 / KCTC 2939 / LMG 18315 / NBRC 16415 / MH) TaxID=1219045 RepID=A0A086PEV3_SPHHM|nr:RpiB/LacA/LacB family sugar-phosphate isomerase [Sphingobium herbicidovorans]KFG91921.1 Sugar-phosphate isomerase, RpiB/LacA/LacB family [Sphingobium herbicidovorans NBRC 16415]